MRTRSSLPKAALAVLCLFLICLWASGDQRSHFRSPWCSPQGWVQDSAHNCCSKHAVDWWAMAMRNTENISPWMTPYTYTWIPPSGK
jgi:hypothetical protein